MKKILTLMAALLISFSAVVKADDAATSKQTLVEAIEGINKDLPQDMGDGLTMQQAYVNDFLKLLVMQFKIDKKAGVDAKQIEAVGDAIRPSMVSSLKQDKESKEMLEILKKAGYGLGFEFVDYLGNSALLICPSSEF